MSVITTRWEWRSFGPTFGPADAVFATLEPTAVQESDEVYLVAPATTLIHRLVGTATVKVRDGLMDVKVLREVDGDGLERWEPVLKATFPLSAEDAAIVVDALGIAPTAPRDAPLTLAELEERLEAAGGRVVPVHKSRVRYVVEDCTAEVTRVTAGDLGTRTIAVESWDREAVLAAIRTLGVEGYRNIAYPAGLAALTAGDLPRFAVIDIGTNSVKLHVGERLEDGSWRQVVDRADVTRLGENLETGGNLDAVALERTIAAIGAMVDEAHRRGVTAIAAVGTAGLRAAGDSAAAIAAIRARTGVHVEVIAGDEEARLAYLATAAALGPTSGSRVVFDTGGGSTQFTFGQDGEVTERFSVPIGAVQVTERFGLDAAVGKSVVDAAQAAIAVRLERIAGRPRPDALVGMGGAVANLAAVKLAMANYDAAVISQTVLDRAEIDRQIERYRTLDADGRRGIVGLQAGRAPVILAGACLVRVVMDVLGHDSLSVVDRGLRHGLLVERFRS